MKDTIYNGTTSMYLERSLNLTTLKRWLQIKWVGSSLKIAFSLLVIGFIFHHGKHELASISFRESFHVMWSLPSYSLVLSIILGLFAVSTMFYYDYLLARSLKLHFPLGKVFRVSWMANTLNGVMGFGGIIGAGLRMYIYRDGTKHQKKLVQGIGWMALAMLSGLSFSSIFVLLNIFPVRALLEAKPWLLMIEIGVLCFLVAYLLIAYYKGKEVASFAITVKYTIVSIMEWFSAATVAYFALYLINGEAPLLTVYGVFFVSAAAGLLSMVPGGLGTFDLTYLIGLGTVGIQPEIVLSSLMLYRAVYYGIPFIIGILLATYELMVRFYAKLKDQPLFEQGLEKSRSFINRRKGMRRKLSLIVMMTLTVICSITSLVYGLMPNSGEEMSICAHFPSWVRLGLDALLVALSIILVMNSKGIFYGSKRSRHAVLYTILLVIPIVLLEGGKAFSLIWFIGLTLLLLVSKSKFTRVRRTITAQRIVQGTLLLMLIYYIYYVFIRPLIEIQHGLVEALPYKEIAMVYLLSLGFFFVVYSLLYYTFKRINYSMKRLSQ